MSNYTFRMLGPFEVSGDDGDIALPRSKKARAVLAYLAMHPRGHRKDHLVDLFFADTRDPKGGLRWVVSRLRATLDHEFVHTNGATIALDSDRYRADVDQLGADVAPDISVAALTRRENAVGGEFLADLSMPRIAEFEAWRLAQQVDCNNHHAALLHGIVKKSLGTLSAIESARKLVNLDVTREESWALLVEALLAMNQTADARHIQRLAVEQLEREGIRLTGKLEKVWQAQKAESTNAAGMALSATAKTGLRPRIAILSCQPRRKSDADIAERITDILFLASNVTKTVTVMAPAFSARLDAAGSTIIATASEIGVDLLLTSTVNHRKGEYLIEVDLIDAATGSSLFHWHRKITEDDIAEFDQPFEANLTARMEIDLPIALISQVRERPQETLTARDYYMLALPRMFSADGFNPVEAHELLENALSLQPYFGQACCALSLIRMFMPQCNDNDEQLEITLSLARRSVEICQDDAFVLGIAAATIGHVAQDTETGIDLALRALSINPYSVLAGIAAAMVHHYHGDNAACLSYIDAVESHSDTEPVSFFCYTCRAMAHYQEKEYEDALKWSRKAVGHNPTFIIAIRYFVASMAQLGMTEEANELARKVIAIDPSENVSYFERRSAYRRKKDTEHLCEGLRKAGLPETA